MRTIGIFTGTRAEYGLLRPLARALLAQPGVAIKLLVSGSHLSATGGNTWQEIADDGLRIDERAEVLLDSGTDTAVYTAIGLGILRYGDALKRMAPEILVLLGDRFETFAAAAAAAVCKIPIAHLHGGEQTLGALDESFRHAITKMSHLHFVSAEPYRKRVIQMGESPDRVFVVGAPGVENVHTTKPMERDEVTRRLLIEPSRPYFLATFHPETLGPDRRDAIDSAQQLRALLDALDLFPEHAVIFTGANADEGGTELNHMLRARAARQARRYRLFASLGTSLYLSAARHAEAVVGNSSSAIIEVPSLGIPSIDIGSRQAGRIRSESVIWCEPKMEQIAAALRRAASMQFRQLAAAARNPYDHPGTTARIASELLSWAPTHSLLKKFHDLP